MRTRQIKMFPMPYKASYPVSLYLGLGFDLHEEMLEEIAVIGFPNHVQYRKSSDDYSIKTKK